ncbi:carbohydrate-binding domain-containing protein [Nitratireductor basaltis]|uniref:Carbohydrate binding module xylan-binding domain-containing protein n=1 Tax=Nitratireductor basaltis TaxID=472175 RepID=A0A084U8H1_9HYPH|nr:carbohydrate-binding domain-containing protein [Nitratireductor basaltis]KFB09257.1 hypothetical protein EL18_00272 [Nitratireductor basaltis]
MKTFLSIAATAAFAAIQLSGATADTAGTRVTVQIAGEAYEGQPEFEVRFGGQVIGRGELTAGIDTVSEGRLFFSPDPDKYLETFEFMVSDKDFQRNAALTVHLMNDRFKEEAWGRDRNIFIRSITVNGKKVFSRNLQLETDAKPEKVDYQAGLLPVYRQNQRAVAQPPAGGWPSPDGRTSRLTVQPHIPAAGG